MKNSQTTSDGILVSTLQRNFCCALGMVLLAEVAAAQPALRLKAWNAADFPDSSRRSAPRRPMRRGDRSHYLVQFGGSPGALQTVALRSRGAAVLSYVPDSALSISMRDNTDIGGLGIRWIGQLRPAQKISPELKQAGGKGQSMVAEFYEDVPESEARAIAIGTGVSIHDNPDLLPHHLLIEGTVDQVRQLADWDEVSYIFPASADLVHGLPVHGCVGALTAAGPVMQSVPLVGEGWAGPEHGSVRLNYDFVYVTAQDPQDSVESEIERAYAEWSKYVQVTFAPSNNPIAPQTLAVLFASGPHGDGYPFTGPHGVVAHTFYPYPLNPEPIAGDQHFNNDVSWRIGGDVDVFSVALHETGHALGLGHSDNPADVMYPYYRMVTGLAPGDIAAIQQQYAPVVPGTPNSPSPPAPIPLVLAIQPPAATTTASSIALSGTTSGGSGSVEVNWSTNQGAAGTAQGSAEWSIAAIPLSLGANLITVAARDATGQQASQSVTVTSELAPIDNPPSGNPNPSPNPSPPPTPSPGGAPPSMTILSPPMTTVWTSDSSIVVSGVARDTLGISQVTWTTSTGGSGIASGTNSWNTGPIALYQGMTTIIIYATDTAGNQAWRSITVTRN